MNRSVIQFINKCAGLGLIGAKDNDNPKNPMVDAILAIVMFIIGLWLSNDSLKAFLGGHMDSFFWEHLALSFVFYGISAYFSFSTYSQLRANSLLQGGRKDG